MQSSEQFIFIQIDWLILSGQPATKPQNRFHSSSYALTVPLVIVRAWLFLREFLVTSRILFIL